MEKNCRCHSHGKLVERSRQLERGKDDLELSVCNAGNQDACNQESVQPGRKGENRQCSDGTDFEQKGDHHDCEGVELHLKPQRPCHVIECPSSTGEQVMQEDGVQKQIH